MKKFLITTLAAAISLPCAIAQSGTSSAGAPKTSSSQSGSSSSGRARGSGAGRQMTLRGPHHQEEEREEHAFPEQR